MKMNTKADENQEKFTEKRNFNLETDESKIFAPLGNDVKPITDQSN
jgi:hypothetical protein